MVTLQLTCPTSGKPVHIRDGNFSTNGIVSANLWVTQIACPHCGESHRWSSSGFAMAMDALHHSPDATRVLVDEAADVVTATALP
jgi:endogenous inhibitor of DNA gyrase (YacG/DUF329 family)